MANPNPNTSGLRPGEFKRQPGPGETLRLSAYLLPHDRARLEKHLEGLTAYQRSREVARLLMQALEQTE